MSESTPENLAAGWPPPTLAAPPAATTTPAPPAPPSDATSPAPEDGERTPGQVAYEAATGHPALAPAQPWRELAGDLREAWEAGAAAVHRDVTERLSAGLADVRRIVADPGAQLPTPTGQTGDPVEAITGWFGHLVGEAERAEQAVRTWLVPAAERGAAEAAELAGRVIGTL